MKNWQYNDLKGLLLVIWGRTTEVEPSGFFLTLMAVAHIAVGIYQRIKEELRIGG